MIPDSRRILFFLGAGFSTDGRKLPVMSAFGRWSDQQARTVRSEWRGTRAAQPALEKISSEFETLRSWCRKAEHVCSLDADNLEELASILEILQHSDLRPPPPILDGDLDSLRTSLNKWVWFLYRTCPPFDHLQASRFNQGDWPQERFVRAVRERVRRGVLAFVTTNYDIVLEAVAWRQGWPLTYPDLGRDEMSRQSLTRNPNGWRSYLGTLTGGPVVCKLHGSVNFVAEADPFDEGVPVVLDLIVPKGMSVGRSRMPMDSPITHPVDSFDEFINTGFPAIVPPTYAKLASPPWLRPHWREAFENVRCATDVVFVGYSLPESDGFMRGFIQSAMAARDVNRPSLRILVIDPSADTWSRYQRLFKPVDAAGRLYHIRASLEHAIDGMIEWLNSAETRSSGST